MREDLARCSMSIHLLGRIYSFVPEGGAASLVEMQHELATERAAQGSFSRLLWIPQAWRSTTTVRRSLLARLRVDPRIQGNADMLETSFEDLRTAIQDWMHREQERREELARRMPSMPPCR